MSLRELGVSESDRGFDLCRLVEVPSRSGTRFKIRAVAPVMKYFFAPKIGCNLSSARISPYRHLIERVLSFRDGTVTTLRSRFAVAREECVSRGRNSPCCRLSPNGSKPP